MRIACWSGPRNISTALMRSFGARSDCVAVDEPLYAAYLHDTGKQHPCRDAILQSQPRDWRIAAAELAQPLPDGIAHQFQKQMAHHLLPDRLDPWLDGSVHVLLVRDPAEMLSSLLAAWPEADLEDTGLPQQLALIAHLGRELPVVDGRDVMDRPQATLRALCARLGLAWDPAMLRWEAGPHSEDGVWGRHWYDSVWRSTGFQPWAPRAIAIPESKRGLLRDCSALYEEILDRSSPVR